MSKSSNFEGVRRFRGSETGGIAILFALLLFPLMLAVGGAIDFLRVYAAKDTLQANLDAAALAAGAFTLDSPDDVVDSQPKLEAEARRYMAANAPSLASDIAVDPVVLTYTPDPVGARHEILLTTRAHVTTAFLRIVGINPISFRVSSSTRRPTVGPLQMAMVLDVTNSMTAASGSTTRMGALRLAASELARQVLSPANPGASVAVVPFSEYVNIGNAAAYRASPPPWLLVPSVERLCPQICRPDPSTTRVCYVDGRVTPCQICSTPSTCPDAVKTTRQFLGCVSPRRSRDDRVTIELNPTSSEWRYPGNRRSCGVPILSLTNVLDDRDRTTTSDVLDYIASISINGSNTYMPGGLIWAWNLLDPREPIVPEPPLNLPKSQSDLSRVAGRNVIVIMSDGENTAVPWGDSFDTVGTPRLNPTPSPTLAETREDTLRICQDMLAANFLIYAVLFDETTTEEDKDTSPSILRTCAGRNDRFYVAADTEELTKAFRNIAQQLARLAVIN